MSHADTLAHLRRQIADSPVVDTHEHLLPIDVLRDELRDGVVGLFRNSYLARNLRTADGSPNGKGPSWKPQLAENSWETVRAASEAVRFSSYYRWLMRALVELYELDEPDLTPASFEYLSDELPRRHADDRWLKGVLDRAHVAGIIWDPYWRPGTTEAPDRRCAPSFRISSSVVAFHPAASDYEGCNLIRDWADELDVDVSTLGDLESLIDLLIERNVAAGSRSLKSPIAYDRTLEVEPVTRAEAERVFGLNPDVASAAQKRVFGDYIIRFFLDRARDHGLVFQVHTGLARLSGSNPLLLEPLLQDFPDVVFDLFHGGYPWVHEVGALAHNYPNVRLNLAWLPQLSTTLAAEALKEWLEVVPQVDRITWGGDCFTAEEMYGSLLAAREAIARAFTDLVDDGHFRMDTAMDAVRSVLAVGGARIYGVELPGELEAAAAPD